MTSQQPLDFNAKVFHAIRTPLSVIREGIDIVLDGTLGSVNSEQKESLDAAKMNVDRLSRLLNSVVEYQKFESGSVALKFERSDLNGLIREIQENFLPIAKKKGVEIRLELDNDAPTITFDRTKIAQVIGKLIKNAVKFTASGTVTVQSQKNGSGARVLVTDQGPGIRPEDLPRVFDSFSHISADPENQMGGTGLGLTISRKIIEAHHGQMAVKSVYGRGCVFSFTIGGSHGS